MCSTDWHKLWRSKLVQSCNNFTLKPKLKPTVITCLAGRDAQEVFILDLSKHRAAIQSDCDSCQTDQQCRYSQDRLFRKDMYRLDWTSKWFVNWESWSFGKNYPLNFLTSVSPFIIRVSGWQVFFSLWPLYLMRYDQKGLVYSHETDIIVCIRLQAAKKERLITVVYVCRFCWGSKNNKAFLFRVACSRRSDSKAREKNSRRKKKKGD